MELQSLQMNQVAPLLAAVLAIGAMLSAICCVFRPPQQVSSIKLLGCLMVLSLTFAANDGVTYPLAIFILATQMTNLGFLENLAALFTKDKDFWQQRPRRHRRHHGGGTPEVNSEPKPVPVGVPD
jgi:hypothetical protein